MRATPQMAGLKREVLVDRHTPVVCRHDRHTGKAKTSDMPTRSGMFSMFRSSEGDSRPRRPLELSHSGCSRHSRRHEPAEVLELGWRGWEAGLRGVAGR